MSIPLDTTVMRFIPLLQFLSCTFRKITHISSQGACWWSFSTSPYSANSAEPCAYLLFDQLQHLHYRPPSYSASLPVAFTASKLFHLNHSMRSSACLHLFNTTVCWLYASQRSCAKRVRPILCDTQHIGQTEIPPLR